MVSGGERCACSLPEQPFERRAAEQVRRRGVFDDRDLQQAVLDVSLCGPRAGEPAAVPDEDEQRLPSHACAVSPFGPAVVSARSGSESNSPTVSRGILHVREHAQFRLAPSSFAARLGGDPADAGVDEDPIVRHRDVDRPPATVFDHRKGVLEPPNTDVRREVVARPRRNDGDGRRLEGVRRCHTVDDGR